MLTHSATLCAHQVFQMVNLCPDWNNSSYHLILWKLNFTQNFLLIDIKNLHSVFSSNIRNHLSTFNSCLHLGYPLIFSLFDIFTYHSWFQGLYNLLQKRLAIFVMRSTDRVLFHLLPLFGTHFFVFFGVFLVLDVVWGNETMASDYVGLILELQFEVLYKSRVIPNQHGKVHAHSQVIWFRGVFFVSFLNRLIHWIK